MSLRRDHDAVGRHLREMDPLKHESGLSNDAITAMRRRTIAAANSAPSSAGQSPATMALAIVLTAVVTFGVVAARKSAEDRAAGAASAAPALRPTQLHFATPGGTRIIWTLDPSFKLGDAHP